MIINRIQKLFRFSFFFLLPFIVKAQYSVSINPANATVNDAITITFTDDDFLNDFYTQDQTTIFMYTGVETDAGTWQLIKGDITNSKSLGITNGGNGSYSVSINPAAYFNVNSGTNVKGINLLFINQFGPNGNNQTGDLYIDLTDALATPLVTVSPSLPGTSEAVTVQFDASGTDLAGANKVYFHSGVSLTPGCPYEFEKTIGNWGQDDQVGEMMSTGNDTWEISLTSLRDYYGVTQADDIFGLNFLFRSADGTLQEDANGYNYFQPVLTDEYFELTEPNYSPALVEKNTAQAIMASANSSADWTLSEIDENGLLISVLNQTSGVSDYSFNYTPTDLAPHYFKLEADIGGTIRYKTFQIKGYDPVTEMARPAGVEPGINYDPNDPTRATLVLHAPTYTRFYKGTGALGGTSTTAAKNVVYVLGDFNNWEINEAYKLNRDRDGWDGTTDVDNDGDRGDYWWITLTNLVPGQEYVFQYLIDGEVQIADPYTHKVSDSEDDEIPANVYPNLINYPGAADDRASVLQTDQTSYEWQVNDFTPPALEDLTIYELHFRDFTEEGTYLAALEKLDYIKNLGINAIHVMPVSEFEGNSSWGYNPNFYFAADKAYGTTNDLKKFIDEAHKRGIAVFNDLVLNHAFHSNVMAKMYWNEAENKPANENPWLNANHKMVRNMAGWWGADWNHESEHTQKMVDRALDYWLQEFQFDGFRFDFTKGIGQTDPNDFPLGDDWASSYNQDRIDLLNRMVNGMKTRNPGAIPIFEHLANANEDKILADANILLWSGVGHHNRMKEFMLGWSDNNIDLYSSGVYNSGSLNYGLPSLISYVESHDEQRLAYELMNYGKHIKDETNPTLQLSMTIDRLKSAALNLVLPGPRMIWQFQELGYDYDINYNGRTGEKPVAFTLGYDQNSKRQELYQLYAQLLEVRNSHNWNWNTIDYSNLGSGADYTTPRRITLSDDVGNYLIVLANHDADNNRNAFPNYPVSGTWYQNDGALNNATFSVNSSAQAYNLAPSQTMILTNFELAVPNYTDQDGDGIYDDVDNCAAFAGSYNLDGCPACEGNSWVSPSSNIPTSNHFYAQTIESAGQIANSSTVNFSAGQSITLKTGFTVSSGGDFHAFIEDCEFENTFSDAPAIESTKISDLSNDSPIRIENPFVKVFPNPLNDRINIQIASPINEELNVYLINAQGFVEPILQKLPVKERSSFQQSIDMRQYPSGMYYLKVIGKNFLDTKKILILR